MSTSDTQTPPTGPLPPSPIPPRPGAPGEDFFARIRGLGIVRPDQGRWAAGVAAGLAHRWGVDPLLVRGGFVALSILGGTGIALYGLCWLFLPHPDGRIHAQEVLSGTVTAGFVGAALATLSLFGDASGDAGPFSWGPWRGIVALAITGLVIWWLVTRKGGPRPGPTGSTSYEPGLPGAQWQSWQGYEGWSPGTAAVRTVDRTSPKHALTLATLGVALVSGTVAGALRFSAAHASVTSSWLVGAAVGLGVVAVGLVIAGLIGRRGGGLVPVAIFLTIACLNGLFWRGPFVEFGNRIWTPTAASQITADGFRQGAGDVVLDLTAPGLLATATPDDPLRVPVQVGAGHLVVKLPSTAVAAVDATVGLGEIQDRIHGTSTEGGGNELTVSTGTGTPVLVVDAQLGAGQLEVTR